MKLKSIKKLINNKGVTLTELMVSTVLFTMLILAVGSVYSNGQRSFYYIEGSANNIQESRRSIEEISRDIRSTIQITSASANSLAFSGNHNGDATTDTISFSKVVQTDGTVLNVTINGVTKTVTEGIVNSSSEPIFKYYDQDGIVVASASDAKMIELHLKIDRDTQRSPSRSTEIVTRIQLRNLHERR